MKRLTVHCTEPTERHLMLAEQHGRADLDGNMLDEFLNGAPVPEGYEMTTGDKGSIIKMSGCVWPHIDNWLGSFGRGPRAQRSLFWALRGALYLKVDGYKAHMMAPGDWIVFDHRREHMVLADGEWLGAAWQLRPSSKTPNAKPTAPAEAQRG